MAHIPYGYQIVGGKAVINKKEAERFCAFVSNYLNGLSVKNAAEMAGLDCKLERAKQLLKRRLYCEDEYYPPIISEEVYDQIQAERARRTRPGYRAPEPAIPVESLFVMKPCIQQHPQGQHPLVHQSQEHRPQVQQAVPYQHWTEYNPGQTLINDPYVAFTDCYNSIQASAAGTRTLRQARDRGNAENRVDERLAS